jgi:adenosine deaminase/adenosine deaminase CECR1
MNTRKISSLVFCLLTAAMLTISAGCAGKNAPNASFRDIHGADPVRLRVFLADMPKGADLHHHLSGTVYAEDYIRWAAEAGLCLDKQDGYTITDPPCQNKTIPAQKALTDSGLWNAAINSYSTRQKRSEPFMWGHEQFFSAFDKLDKAEFRGRMLAKAARLAARDKVSYVETQLTLYPEDLRDIAEKAEKPLARGDFARAYSALAEAGLFDSKRISEVKGKIHAWEETRDKILGKGPGSEVKIRYINEIIRVLPREEVFAQLAFSFALACEDPRVLGLNMVGAEDHPVSMSDYELHMGMVDFLYNLYRSDPYKKEKADRVHIALHAGELTLGLVDPEELDNHIRLAVEKGHARRIGHGVSIAYENRPHQLMDQMRYKDVAVATLLSSNKITLGLSGERHPLNFYREHGVPVVLATDDMGVTRSDMTNQYMRAFLEQGLSYKDLKEVSRNSLEYSFLPGWSMWADYTLKTRVKQCSGDPLQSPGQDCAAFLEKNEKARMQWEHELRVQRFEEKWLRRKGE